MILLAVNCGFGNEDCGTLPLSALDLKGGWVAHARPKTGVEFQLHGSRQRLTKTRSAARMA